MIDISMQTALILYSLCFTIGFAIMTVYYFLQNKDGSFFYFMLFFLMGAIGSIMIVFRDYLNPFLSIIVSNNLIVLGYTLLAYGVSKNLNKKFNKFISIFGILISIFFFILFTYIEFNTIARIYVVNLAIIYFIVYSMFIIRSNKRELLKIFKVDLMTITLLLVLFVTIYRMVLVLIVEEKSAVFLDFSNDAFSVALVGIVNLLIVTGIFSMHNNIQNEQLKLTEKLLQSAIDSAEEMVIFTLDKDLNYTYFNTYHKNSMKQIYGTNVEKGKYILDLVTIEDDYHKARLNYEKVISGQTFVNIEAYGEEENPMYFESRFFPVYDSQKNIIGASVFAGDITQRIATEKKVIHISNHDSLTGVFNRRYFDKYLKDINQSHIPLGIVLGDINGLKIVNDAFGHKAGDVLLKGISNAITKELRNDQVVMRIGGDEFVIFLPNINEIILERILEQIHINVNEIDVHSITPSISFGYKIFDNIDEDIETYYKECEDELYRRKLTDSRSMHNKVINLVKRTLFEKNDREANHSERVGMFSKKLAIALGFKEQMVKDIELAATMHDIGKIGIDEQILNKVGAITQEEYKEIKKHSEIGYRILSSHSEFSMTAEIVLQHHERLDGRGYPQGLTEKDILPGAKIIHIADSYDAMISERTYKDKLSIQKAIKELRSNSGTQFDKKYVDIFISEVLNFDET